MSGKLRALTGTAFLLMFLLAWQAGTDGVPAGASSAAVQGDLDCSGAVALDDVTAGLRDSAGLGAAGCAPDAGDTDCDGQFTPADLLPVLSYLAGDSQGVAGCNHVGEPIEPLETSEAKIAAALEAGEIDYETSLLYRAYAAFGDSRLPPEYQSPTPDLHAAGELAAEIFENEAALGQDLLDDLAFFTARPNDPASIFSQAAPLSPGAQGDPLGTWVSRAAVNGKARVWVRAGDDADTLLGTYAALTEELWPKVFSLINPPIQDTPGEPLINPDNAIDIYFVNVGDVDQRLSGCRLSPDGEGCRFANAGGAYTRPQNPRAGQTASAAILMDAGMSVSFLAPALAHELFHAGQFTYDYMETSWLKDATATWAQDRVMQMLSRPRTDEFAYLPAFFNNLEKPLTRDTESDLNRYASWLFFRSLQMNEGDVAIRQVWEKAAAAGQQGEGAVDQVSPFKKEFPIFALRNWNRDPVTPLYKDMDATFPAYAPRVVKAHMGGPGDDPLEPYVEFLGARYFQYTFDQSVRTITLDNKYAGIDHLHVWVIPKIAGEWKAPEDVTNLPLKSWCRDFQEEDVDELVVVISNDHWNATSSPPAPEPPVMKGEALGCEGQGVITITREKHGTYTSNRGNPVEVNMTDTATIRFKLEADEFDPGSFFSDTSTITWSYSLSAVETADECVLEEGAEGGGTYIGEDGPSMLLGWEAPDGTLFGMVLNEDSYAVIASPPGLEMEDGDPRGWYQGYSDICGVFNFTFMFPYTTLAIVSGPIPANNGSFSGSRQRTLPPLFEQDVPTVETVTWHIDVSPN